MMNAKPTITTTDWTRNDGAQSTLKQPTLNELLAITFEERQYSRPPQLIWLCMGGYRRSRFAAPHMSAFGTKQTLMTPLLFCPFWGQSGQPDWVRCCARAERFRNERGWEKGAPLARGLSVSEERRT
jgi:hypothetical protein